MWIVVINFLNIIFLTVLIYLMFTKINREKIAIKITTTKGYNRLIEYVKQIPKNQVYYNKKNYFTPVVLLVLMVLVFSVMFVLFYSFFRVVSTALILALPFLFSPIILIKILINKEKSEIIKKLPMYIVNIKNHIEDDNNIIGAIQKTIVEEPLKKYIEVFKININRGMKVIEAFDLLKKEVNVKTFTTFINTCQVCYLNGGDFNNVLEHYISIITKENIHKEATKEKAYSDIITLIVMLVLNVLVIVAFVFTNREYAIIMRETFFGKLLLNFNAISYIVIVYLISKIYKEE